ncbi:MAG: peptide deformylase [Cumulibacter sp.]
MSVTPIRLFGDPILRTSCEPVTSFDRELAKLVDDLRDTMLAAQGAGLAAPQIGVGARVFTYNVDGEVGHLVNPVVEYTSEEEQTDDEGCLSIPGLHFPCTRPLQVRATGFDVHGEPVVISAERLLARAVLHEIDHLDGVMFVDKLDTATRKAAMRAIREAEWANQPVPVIKVSPHPSPFGL